jgi:CBS domain-containing membrane protein
MNALSHSCALLMSERWRASVGALLGMGLCALLLHALAGVGHWMLVPLAGTLVILYVQPHSPVAQPWPVVGIVTQSDMLAALYKRIAVSEAAPRG